MEDDYIYPQFDDHEEIIDKDIMHKFFHVEVRIKKHKIEKNKTMKFFFNFLFIF